MLRIHKVLMTIILLSFVVILTGCSSGSDSDSDTNGAPSVVVSTSTFTANGTCPNGGIEIKSGIDENGNGTLDTDEVDNTQTVCNGTDGTTSLILVTAESAGSNCTYGGYKIETGLDTNSNDILDTSEVLQTIYICNGSIVSNATLLVPGAYPTIQAAINVANDGDTVLVSDGTYTENIDFKGKGITLRSVNGADTTTIDGNGIANNSVTFSPGNTASSVLEGFTITNGRNITNMSGGGILCYSSSPTIKNCIISGNFYAGIACVSFSSPSIINCIVKNNSWFGLALSESSNPTLINCTIFENSYGGILCENSNLSIVNCTISNNTGYGGTYIDNWSNQMPITIINSILYGNTATFSGVYGNDLFFFGGGSIIITYSNINPAYIQNGTVSLPNSINADPLFVDAAGGNFKLQAGSPCIDVGTSDTVTYPDLPTYDIEGDARPQGAGYDMGSDEAY